MANIICPSCKTPAPPGAIFCDNCGFDLRAITAVSDQPLESTSGASGISSDAITCSNCGYVNLAGSTFCENCGTQLPKQVSAVKSPPGPVPPAPQPPTPKAPEISPTPESMADTFVGQSLPKAVVESIPGRLIIPSKNISIPIPPGSQSIIIGREDPVSGIFPDVDLDPHGGHEAGVGRRHAQLLLQSGKVFIQDLDSVNGTVVNKQKLTPRDLHPVEPGDELRLGKLILVYMDK